MAMFWQAMWSAMVTPTGVGPLSSLPVVLMIKESINRSFESGLNEGLLFERRVFHSSFALDDQKEGMAAFSEKRQPQFRDK